MAKAIKWERWINKKSSQVGRGLHGIMSTFGVGGKAEWLLPSPFLFLCRRRQLFVRANRTGAGLEREREKGVNVGNNGRKKFQNCRRKINWILCGKTVHGKCLIVYYTQRRLIFTKTLIKMIYLLVRISKFYIFSTFEIRIC